MPGGPASATASRDRLLTALLLLATGAAAFQPVKNYDLWWHLATGRLMVAEGRIPWSDPFSFTRAGAGWLDHEWLFQLATYLGYRIADWRFLALGTVAVGLATMVLLRQCVLARAGNAPAIWLLLALSVAGARFRFDPRPEMVSYLLLVALCALLQFSRAPGRSPLAWCLFPLFALWANSHPAALLGAAALVLWLAGERIQDRLRGNKVTHASLREKVALASPLALLLNPGGWRLLRVPLEIRHIVTSGHAPNQEWLPPTFSDFGLFYTTAMLSGLVLLGSIYPLLSASFPSLRPTEGASFPGAGERPAGAASSLRLGLGQVDWPPVLVVALATWMGFQQLRNIGFFFLLLPLALGQPLACLTQRGRIPASVTRFLGGAMLTLLTLVFLRAAPGWNKAAYLERVAPVSAVRFLEQYGVGRRLFNDVKFGGYLIWARYPEHPVFIDGRNEVYEPLLAEIFQALSSWERWEGMLKRHQIDAAMLRRGQLQAVEYNSPGPARRMEMRAFSAAYFQTSRWALVYWDDQALVFVRRDDPTYSRLLEREYRIVNPDDSAHLLQAIRQGRVGLEEALREVDRKLAEDPACLTAHSLRRQIAALKAPHPS
ncbi:MAG: hypothetical protein DMH00_06905 [Acidobacteria bacterium]|nr:MAG: hypothetical protein DMH00_06905 [Acidobacteriota bacterium]